MCSPPWGEVEVGVFGSYTTAVGLVFGGTTLSSGAVILAAVVLVAGRTGLQIEVAIIAASAK